MHPHPLRPRSTTFTILLAATLAAAPALRAQQQDVPAIDAGQLLQALRGIREQQSTQLKAQKQTAVQQINSVVGSPERSIQLWEDAVRATQFDGMAKEGAQFRAWKENEGELLKERLVQSAIHLQLSWLAITLQRSAGVKVKDLLPAIATYTKELSADEAAAELLAESMKKEKEAAAIAPPGGGNRRNPNQPGKVNEGAIKRMHDQILKPALAASPVVKWMNLADAVRVDKWENNPGNFDGIFTTIILPELRDQKDARALEYWDIKLKKEADAASRSKLAFEIEKFNTQRRPTLLWNRSLEYVSLGQKNRAVSEMFTLIKTHPTHPDAEDWITRLEQLLLPPAPAATSSAQPSAAPVPGL